MLFADKKYNSSHTFRRPYACGGERGLCEAEMKRCKVEDDGLFQ